MQRAFTAVGIYNMLDLFRLISLKKLPACILSCFGCSRMSERECVEVLSDGYQMCAAHVFF